MQFAPGETNFLRRILRENRCAAAGALAFAFTTHFRTGDFSLRATTVLLSYLAYREKLLGTVIKLLSARNADN